ncbi:MAG: hypothetical protein ACRDVO_12715 [Jiangellaceae bacterium]
MSSARPVRTHEPDQFTGPDAERDAVERTHAEQPGTSSIDDDTPGVQ